jgi:hypothetical protein
VVDPRIKIYRFSKCEPKITPSANPVSMNTEKWWNTTAGNQIPEKFTRFKMLQQ